MANTEGDQILETHGLPSSAPEYLRHLAELDRSNPKVRQLMDAAYQLFLSHPYDAVSTDAIAKAASVSKATLYVYFPSKEALFAALVSEKCERTEHLIWSALPTSQGIQEVLLSIARQFIQIFASCDGLAFYRSLIAQIPRFPELGEIFYESGPRIVHEKIEALLRTADAQGQLAVPDPALAARQFLQLVSADIQLNGLLGLPPLSEQRISETIESGVALFVRGYSPSEAPA